MAPWWSQVKLLLWKDFLIRRRKLITLFGVVWATLVVGSLWMVRINVNNEYHTSCQYPARALPSAGMLTFLQSFICSINNECSPLHQYQQIPEYETSRFSQLRRQFGPLLYNETVVEVASSVPDGLKLLATVARVADDPDLIRIIERGLKVKDLFISPYRVRRQLSSTLSLGEHAADALLEADISFKAILAGKLNKCSFDALSEVFLAKDHEAVAILADSVCSMSDDEIQKMLLRLLPEVNINKYFKLIGDMVYRLNGDGRVTALGDTITALLRMVDPTSFLPLELTPIFARHRSEADFSYFNLTIITKLMDLFEPTFGETEAYMSVRDVTDAVVAGPQWLYRLLHRQADAAGSVPAAAGQDLLDRDKVTLDQRVQNSFDVFEKSMSSENAVGEVFDTLSKMANFALKWLPARDRHSVLFYSTLLAKLVEGAHRVISDNLRLEEIVYDVCSRHPAAMGVITQLPVEVVANAFDALTDASRLEILTSKITNPGSVFCDVKRLQSMLRTRDPLTARLKALMCTDVWRNYMRDLIQAFGISAVRDNINVMASLLIQETIGKDTSDRLYSMERGFRVLETFSRELMQVGSRAPRALHWQRLLNVSGDSELMTVIASKRHLKNQILITVHGALAHEVVKQNTILEAKITPVLLDATDVLVGLNGELGGVARPLVAALKHNYGGLLQTVLLTLLDHDKTLKALSTNAVEIFCSGVDNASLYVNFPPSVVKQQPFVDVLCETSKQIEKSLKANSTIGQAIKRVTTVKRDPLAEVRWSKLINNLKNLYKTLDEDYPYMFEITSYGLEGDDKHVSEQLVDEVKQFWFSRRNMSRTVHLCFKFGFQLLDLIDRDIFNVARDVWLKMKYVADRTNSLLVIIDQAVKLITDVNNREVLIKSELPPSTVTAVRDILPNIPQLIVDAVNLIVANNTDVSSIISMMNAVPAWPCADSSLADRIAVSDGSAAAVRAMEAILCVGGAVQREWGEYAHANKLATITSLTKANTTRYPPHLFLELSATVDALVRDVKALRAAVEGLVAERPTLVDAPGGPSLASAWNYAADVMASESVKPKLRSLLSNVDTVLNSMNSSSIEAVPLNTIWVSYLKCSDVTLPDEQCKELARAAWKNIIKFASLVFNEAAKDLLKYFTEINEPDANVIQIVGFTKSTGLYILYEKFPDFAGVLLNSYWDYGFMNQIRRASKSLFWDCEAVVEALVVPPGSALSREHLRAVKPYVCPSLLYWISLPRGENTLLDVVAKPQYFFYNMQASDLTSVFEHAYDNMIGLIHVTDNVPNTTFTDITPDKINTIESKFEEIIDNVISWRLTDKDASYRLFNEVNKKQFISTVYLTRIAAITNKLSTAINNLTVTDLIDEGSNRNDSKKLELELLTVQRLFKRRPSEALAIHFDVITDMLWDVNGNYSLVDALSATCDNFKNNVTKDILNEGGRVKNQICSKRYGLMYKNVDGDLKEDLIRAEKSLLSFVNSLLNSNESGEINLFEYLNERKELISNLKMSIKYADDMSLPIYVQYLDSNLRHYSVMLSFLAGEDWWRELKDLYSGPYAALFFNVLEHSIDITENILTHLDRIHLVRLIRDMNINETETFCLDNLTLSDYIPDASGLLSDMKRQMCHLDRTDLFRELPQLAIASQGYDNKLKLSREVDYTSLEDHISTVEDKLSSIRWGPKPPSPPFWITSDRLDKLKMAAMGLFSRETITKVAFGMIGNVVDGSILFLNKSQCTVCSSLTSWLKQLNLQLYKKQEYEALLCRLHDLTLQDIYRVLRSDFHWDMAIKELISARNYTRLELNKSMNEFLEQVKLHVLDDLTAADTKLGQCLAHNHTMNAFGNASLFLSAASKALLLLRSAMPHIHEVEGVTEVPFFKQLASQVAHRLHPVMPLASVMRGDYDVTGELKAVASHELVKEISEADVDVYRLKMYPNSSVTSWLYLSNSDWSDVCHIANCTELSSIVSRGVNAKWINDELNNLQKGEFWTFRFVSAILEGMEGLLSHAARLLGVASGVDVEGAMEGRLVPILDLLLRILQEETMDTIIYSLEGVTQELHPLLRDTPLDRDLHALGAGLRAIAQFRDYIIANGDLKLKVSELFPEPERAEARLSALGINDTEFWSMAAPRIRDGYVLLKPMLSLKAGLASALCSPSLLAPMLAVADAEAVAAHVARQLCHGDDGRHKRTLSELAASLNLTYVMDKVVDMVLTEVYAASNLTREEGAGVLAHYAAMLSLLPVVQANVGNLTDVLANEPLLAAFKTSNTLNNLLSSSEFLSSAGNMLCGKPFVGNDNRFYKAIAEAPDFATTLDPLQLEALPTDFCKSLYKDVLSMGGGKIVWSFVKPLLMGKILFTPPTPVVMNIIEKANASFAHMSRVTRVLHKFARSFTSVQQIAEHRRGLRALRELLSSSVFQQLGASIMSAEGDATLPDVDMDELFDDFGDLKDIGSLLMKASDLLQCINLNRFHPAPDEFKLSNEAVKLTRINEFAAGLVFTNIEHMDDKPINVEYKIRMDIDSVPTTTRKRNQFWTPGPEGNFLEDMRYFRGFVQIQDLIDKAIIQSAPLNRTARAKRAPTQQEEPDWAIYTQQIPYPCYMKDYFQSSLYESQALIVAFFFAFIMTVSSAVRFIVSEKETGNTMLMSIMGVRLGNHTFSWFVASFTEMLATVTAMFLVLRLGGILPHSDPWLLWLLMVNYGFSVIMFCYLMSKLFSTASIGAVCSVLALLFSFMPYVIILCLEADLSYVQKILTGTSMSTAFCYCMLLVTRLEAGGGGAHWAHVWGKGAADGAGVGLSTASALVLLDGLLYLLLGWIIDRYFGPKTLMSNITYTTSSSEKAGVSIVNVSKTYGGRGARGKMALDNVSIELHRGHITTLLGQNGAGKTTLIKIITGMLKPTKGHVIVRSDSLHNDLTRLGVCPQQDVLFENMSTVEHLMLYAQLKSGLPLADVKDEVDSMLRVLSLGSRSEEQARRLSGGLRRRLCVALAFVARPRLVLLDEPSSGVDPAARRDIWSLIMKLKEHRTVLLTTHHLDEAELLSDQIVIMHKGQVHTTGTPIEIKRSLGNGYKLTVAYPERHSRSLQDLGPAEEETWVEREHDDVTMEERAKRALTAVRSGVANAQLVDVCGDELEIMMPFFDASGANNDFLGACESLERARPELRWSEAGVECCGLEQVMQNITSGHSDQVYDTNYDAPSKSGSASSVRDDVTSLVSPAGALRGTPWAQYTALLHKRWTHYTRNKWLLFLLIALPSIFVAVSMGFSLIRPPYDNEVALLLSPDLYSEGTQFLVTPDTTSDGHDEIFQSISKVFTDAYTPASMWTPQESLSCECKDLRQECDYSTYNQTVPKLMLLPNASTLNDWLISTQEFYIEKRYGGYSSSPSNTTASVARLVAWYNNKGHHALPAHTSALSSAWLRARTSLARARIATYTHPLKISDEQLSKSTVLQHVADVGIAAMLLLAYSLVPAGAAVYLVQERVSRQTRLQLLCGVSPRVYWAAALTWDTMIIIVNIIITACVLLCFNLPVFVYRDNLPAISILLLLFGFSCNSLTHVMEKLFRESSMANMILFCGNLFVGCSCLAILLILDIISESDRTDDARWALHKIFLLSPQFALGDALVEMAKNTVQAQVLSRFGMDTYKSPLGTDMVSLHYLALLGTGLALMCLNLMLEYHCFSFITRWSERTVALHDDVDEEKEVAEERRRVHRSLLEDMRPLRINTIGNINAGFVETEGGKVGKAGKDKKVRQLVSPLQDVAQCVDVSKTYRGRSAVAHLTLGIPRGQCTALLGENGAGKSTTFAMLCGELRPTAGSIVLDQQVASRRDLNTGLVSYCPQSDALDPLLTVTETLQFYCRLRGILDQHEVIKQTLSMFDLSKYSEVLNGALSGGNKRKLCTAVAFMGRSPLVLLDEPTSGMDPGSRACVSRGVRAAVRAGRGVLLSTHALGDARRLARRVALLREGRLLQHCLTRFGGGYTVMARAAGGAGAAWAAVRARAPHAQLRALHVHTLQFVLPDIRTVDGKSVRTELSDIFRLMAELQSECDIEDYTITQTSLDQMFLSSSEEDPVVTDPLAAPSAPPATPLRPCGSPTDLDTVTAL